MIFENTANYSIGDLTDEAIALANVAEGEEEQSELWVYHVTAWDGANRKWTTNLPVNDHPIDILVSINYLPILFPVKVSQKLIGVLTIQRNLRVFTLQGTQRHIIAHPGPTLTACCFDTKFAIISFTGSEYYENAGKDNAQYNVIFLFSLIIKTFAFSTQLQSTIWILSYGTTLNQMYQSLILLSSREKPLLG